MSETPYPSHWLEKILWGLLVFIAASGVQTLRELTSNVNELNQSMAVILQKMIIYDKEIDEHGVRINVLEQKRR